LYFEINHNPLRASTQAYFDAVTLYAWEITATTNWMMGKPGLMKKLIHSELKAGRRVSIVTFNIDLLAENALRCLDGARPSAKWCLNDAYGFSPSKEGVNYTARDYEGHFDYSGTAADIKLFKMHGSVNWVFQHRDKHPPADLVSRARDFYVVTNERLPQRTLAIRHSKGRRPWYISPLIVPPVYEKHGFIKRHLQEVWDGASKALLDASRVVFWGYSFPQADTHARHFFQGLSQENAALQKSITINPDPNAESALWDVLRPKSVRHYRSAEDYLTR
jgi:SIR2-like domain